MRSFCSGYPGSIILGHGHITLPAYREGLTYRVFSAEQGKSVSLPYWGSEAVRRIDGDADSGTEKKRMLPCNWADRGCVAFLDNITSPETEQTSRWCSSSRTFAEPINEAKQMTTTQAVGAASHTPGGFIHRRVSWPQTRIE
jgi:hypothetical protein